MKKVISIVLAAIVSFSIFSGSMVNAQENQGLSQDLRLALAADNYKKAQMFMEKGQDRLRMRPGHAQQLFEYAESYFNNAAFEYGQVSEVYGVDTSKEVADCKRLSREAHVWISKARRERKRAGAGY